MQIKSADLRKTCAFCIGSVKKDQKLFYFLSLCGIGLAIAEDEDLSVLENFLYSVLCTLYSF